MTIMATHFAIVLGAWRLRVRIDIDEPREDELTDAHAGPRAVPQRPAAPSELPGLTPRGWG